MAEETKTVRTVDITPTWLVLVESMLEVIRQGPGTTREQYEANSHVVGEFKKMAGLADALQEWHRNLPEIRQELKDALDFAAREFRRLGRENSALQIDRGLEALKRL